MAIALATRPDQLVFFVRTRVARYARVVLRLRRPTTSAQDHERGPRAVLTHVAVDGAARGAGAGAALVDAYLAVARGAGRSEATLVTMADEHGAGRFYERLGWTRGEDHRDYDGRVMAFYARSL